MKAVLLASLAGLCWGVGELFTRSVLHTGKIGPITAIAMRLGAEPRDWHRAETSTILKLVLGSGVIAGAFAMLFFYGALHIGEVSRVKPIAFTLAPAVAVLLGWLVLGEAMTARKAIGVGLILSGIVVLASK